MPKLSALVMWSLALTLVADPSGAQQTPPRQQNGGGVRQPVRPPSQTPAPSTPPATTPPVTTPPTTTPPTTSLPATCPPATTPPVTSSPATPPGGITHSNGLGQTYVNFTPRGTPGNPATYNSALAAAAANAWPPAAPFSQVMCPTPGVSAISKQTQTCCAVWAYTGSVAGRVTLNRTNNTCYCPTASAPPWN